MWWYKMFTMKDGVEQFFGKNLQSSFDTVLYADFLKKIHGLK